jgi:hypothetical protein
VRLSERVTPIGAVLGVLSTLVCCLPLGFAGAVGAAGLGAVIAPFRPWLIGLSLVLLGVGFMQVYRRPPSCERRSTTHVVILWGCAIVVAVVLLLPQLLPSLLADWLG